MRYLLAFIFVSVIFLSAQVNPVLAAKKAVPKPTPKPLYSCSVRKTVCAQMRSCAEAVFYYRSCGFRKLDRDNDGVPCETICK